MQGLAKKSALVRRRPACVGRITPISQALLAQVAIEKCLDQVVEGLALLNLHPVGYAVYPAPGVWNPPRPGLKS